MQIPRGDRDILRRLAARIAEIAQLSVQQEKKKMWRRNNDLQPIKPMIYIYQIPWQEMNYNDELTLRCAEREAQTIEEDLRKTIYRWEHMPGDMVVEPVFYSPPVVSDTGILEFRQENIGLAQKFEIQIRDEEDIEKIRMPEVVLDREKTEEIYNFYCGLFGDILDVKKRGIASYRFAPWDELVRWTGVQEVLADLAMRPEYIHRLMERLTRAHLHRLKQYEKLDLIADNNNDCITGDGGLGYTGELPRNRDDDQQTGTQDLWGAAAAQIFSEVSPDMHEEFALRYEGQWLERFGMVYYGCCEPLHGKIEVLKDNIPNLRKISCSPWADVASFAEQCGRDYVLSLKPNPNIFCKKKFDPAEAREELTTSLNRARGCSVEVIMKDISTVAGEPQRLWKWTEIAAEVTAEFA